MSSLHPSFAHSALPEPLHRPRRTDFLSVMSFIAPPSGELNIINHNNNNNNNNSPADKDVNHVSPMTSPSMSTSSNASLSPLGLQCPTPSAQDDKSVGSPQPMTSSSRHDAAPGTAMTSGGTVRHNNVGTVTLAGVSIVSLFIDGKERLCLAQISNTLLKKYSYNEIHNRRVALGITCVQCTPVQLEILRRAGAMPISSRRCGMITKREAERLVKSFLEDTAPPKLPDNFAFEVVHQCGWGCRGSFIPSRYNSSRAKCIKCTFCNMYFSPNKFIFHFHRTPESKYNHPDAANFNSWRRHLKLANSEPEDIFHCWEDVKAMFNGGSRKRVLTSSAPTSLSSPSASSSRSSPGHQNSTVAKKETLINSGTSNSREAKKAKFSEDHLTRDTHGSMVSSAAGHSPFGPTPPHPQYPVFPMPNKFLPGLRPAPPGPHPHPPPPPPTNSHNHPAFCLQPPHIYPQLAKDQRLLKGITANWGGLPDSVCPPYEMIWAKHLGLSPVENGMVLDPRLKPLGPPPAPPATRDESQAVTGTSTRSPPLHQQHHHQHHHSPDRNNHTNSNALRFTRYPSPDLSPEDYSTRSGKNYTVNAKEARLSAFRPVSHTLNSTRRHTSSPMQDVRESAVIPDGIAHDNPEDCSETDEPVDVDTIDSEPTEERIPEIQTGIPNPHGRILELPDHNQDYTGIAEHCSLSEPSRTRRTSSGHERITEPLSSSGRTCEENNNVHVEKLSMSRLSASGSDDVMDSSQSHSDQRRMSTSCSPPVSPPSSPHCSLTDVPKRTSCSPELFPTNALSSEQSTTQGERSCHSAGPTHKDTLRSHSHNSAVEHAQEEPKISELHERSEPWETISDVTRTGSALQQRRLQHESQEFDECDEETAQDTELSRPDKPDQDSLHVLSKEELQKELITEMEARRRLEVDCKTIKETFKEQVEREKKFRDEMAKQLQNMKEKLCQELDQERQVRVSLQQKLKEAHEALDNFSSKMRSSVACSDCTNYKDSLVQR